MNSPTGEFLLRASLEILALKVFHFNLDSPLYLTPDLTKSLQVQAPFYAMLMFNIAKFGSNPSIYPVSGINGLKIWVSLNPLQGNSFSIVIINKKSKGNPIPITIKLGSSSTYASKIEMVSSGGLSAVNGSKFGGSDFNDNQAPFAQVSVPIVNSKISLNVGSSSAVLVRISNYDLGPMLNTSADNNVGGSFEGSPGNRKFGSTSFKLQISWTLVVLLLILVF